MSKVRMHAIAVCAIVWLGFTGCATKKHVREAVAPVQGQINQVQNETAENQRAIGDLDRTAASADEKAQDAGRKAADAMNAVSRAAGGAQQAAARADSANVAAQQATAAAATATRNLNHALQNLDNYQLEMSARVLFRTGAAELSPEAKKELDQTLASAGDLHGSIIEVEGYTDSTGSGASNYELSRKRADAVTHYLVVDKNVPLRNVRVVGAGSEAPSGDDKSRDDRKNARRVEVKIYSRNLKPAPSAAIKISAVHTGPLLLASAPFLIEPSHTAQLAQLVIRDAGRAFLLSGEKEPQGYGLYSYLLFPSKAVNDAQKQLYLKFVEAYLSLNELSKVEAAIKTDGPLDIKLLHRAAVPLTKAVSDASAATILDTYDYSRASELVANAVTSRSARDRVRGGPYLVCTLQPLSQGIPQDRLVHVLDWVPPGDLVNAWFQFFLTQATAPRDWNSKSFYEMALDTQTWLENTAQTVPQVRSAVMTALVWFTGQSAKTPGK